MLSWTRAMLLLALLLPPVCHAQEDQPDARQPGELVPTQSLQDEQFGVSVDALALRRQVQMYQWQVEVGADGNVVWLGVWSADSLKIPAAQVDEEHINPASIPFASVEWRAGSVQLDGHPADPALFRHFDDWESVPVDVAQLPSNLSASLREMNGCLFSGDDPMSPAVGDIRVCWQQLPAGQISGSVQLQAGRWVAADQPIQRAAQTDDFALTDVPGDIPMWMLALGVAVLLIVVPLIRGRTRR